MAAIRNTRPNAESMLQAVTLKDTVSHFIKNVSSLAGTEVDSKVQSNHFSLIRLIEASGQIGQMQQGDRAKHQVDQRHCWRALTETYGIW